MFLNLSNISFTSFVLEGGKRGLHIASLFVNNSQHANNGALRHKTTQYVGPSNPLHGIASLGDPPILTLFVMPPNL